MDGVTDWLSDQALRSLTADFQTRAAAHDAGASFPFENFARLHGTGLLGLTVPRRLGGEEASLASVRRVIEAVARGEASTALVLVMQSFPQQSAGATLPRRALQPHPHAAERRHPHQCGAAGFRLKPRYASHSCLENTMIRLAHKTIAFENMEYYK